MAKDRGSRIEDRFEMEAEKDSSDSNNRIGRHATTRMSEIRDQYRRDLMDNKWKDPLYINPKYLNPDCDYLWVRESLLGTPDDGNFAEMRNRGWEPVKSDRFADIFADDIFGKSTQKGGYRYLRGLVLCERPKDIGDMEREKLRRKTEKEINSLNGLNNNMSDNLTQQDFNQVKRGYLVDF